VQDVFASLVLVGIAIALWIRLVQRPERFVGSHRMEALRILGLITWIILTLFLLRGAKIALGESAYATAWTPVSTAASHLFTWMSETGIVLAVLPGAHLLLVFVLYLPYSKHLHIITSAFNVWFSSTRPRGALEPLRIDMEKLEAGEQSLGAETVTDLTRKELLDLYACTECGRCQSACPAWNTGKPLSPKLLIMGLRDHLFDEGPRILEALAAGETPTHVALVPGIVDDDVVWSCTTCGACMRSAGGHRAHRHDRGSAPCAGDGRIGSRPRPGP
jgi:ferredoxin